MQNVSLAGSTALPSLHPLPSLLVFQAPAVDTAQMNHLVLFVGIAAFSLLFVALAVLGAILSSIKAQRELSSELKKFRDEASQLIVKSHALVVELTPQIRRIADKVDTITAHVDHLAALVHEKADEIAPTITAANETVLEANNIVRETMRSANATAQDANRKTRAQISRVDGMVTTALNSAVRLGVAIEQGIAKPGREVAGVIAGLKAGFETLSVAASRALHSAPSGTRTAVPRPLPGPAPARRSFDEPTQPVYPVPVRRDSDY